MSALDAFRETKIVSIIVRHDVDARGRGCIELEDRMRISSLAANGREENAALVAIRWTGENADFDIAVYDKGESNGVLILSKKALGTV